jgi:long-chain acyl-CoA synthetase
MTTDATQVRAQIDAEVSGRTVCHLLQRNAAELPNAPALSVKVGEAWETLSWSQYRERVAETALGLMAVGMKPGNHVAIMARNIPEHLIADLGIVHGRGIPVSMYNTLAPDQIAYIAGHCEARIAIVENKTFMERWEKVRSELPSLEKVVMITGAEEFSDYDWVMSWDELLESGREQLAGTEGRETFESTWQQVRPEDHATLIYTSGTTGNPKGVILTHYNVVWTAESLTMMGTAPPRGTRYVSYLPLAHSAERMGTHYAGLHHATHVHFCPEIPQIFEFVPQVRPYSFVGVPRVWEKLQAGIRAKVSMEPDERKRKIAEKALDLAVEIEMRRNTGKSVPLMMKLQHKLFERLVYSKIRHTLGLDECEIPISGAAPIAPEVMYFFWGIGVRIYELYGLTETSAPATANPKDAQRLGTIGVAMPGVEVKLLEDGELLLRGGNITQGYFKEPEKTAEALDDEGWLHTGDIAQIEPDGYIRIVDRKKELIVTPGGKNISPSNIEALVKQHPLVGQVCVIGDRRKFISALIVLDGEVAPTWAQRKGVEFTDIASFAKNPQVVAEMEKAIETANASLSQVEKIKKFTVLPTEWTPESEELTPSLKLKRRVIETKYVEDIDAMYAG